MKKVFIYFVTWCLSIEVPAPCPNKPTPDEFGRMQSSVCAVYHYKIQKDCEHRTEYMSRDSAVAFLKRAKKERDVVDVKLDSVIYHGIVD